MDIMVYRYCCIWILWYIDIVQHEVGYYCIWILWYIDIVVYGYYGIYMDIIVYGYYGI